VTVLCTVLFPGLIIPCGDELLVATFKVLCMIGVFTSLVDEYHLLWMNTLVLDWQPNSSGVVIVNNIAPSFVQSCIFVLNRDPGTYLLEKALA
jgi:hypothetical protein